MPRVDSKHAAGHSLAMAFVRVTHSDGDVETFHVVDGTTSACSVGRDNRHAIALPSASVAANAGSLSIDDDGICRFRNALTDKTRRLDAPLEIGPFTLKHVDNGPMPAPYPGPWACGFRPRSIWRYGSLCILSTEAGLSQGHALAIDLDDADGTLYEAYTWRTADKRFDAKMDQRVDAALVIEGTARHPSDSHLIQPVKLHRGDDVNALLFPFVPALPLHSVILSAAGAGAKAKKGEQRRPPAPPKIPRAIGLGIQAQIGRLLTERDAIRSGAFPLDWTRVRICDDGRVRLIPAAPWAWREPGAPSNLGALLAATAAMIGANFEDASTPLGAVGNILTRGGLAFLQDRTPQGEVDQVRGWLRGIASESLGRQRNYAEQAQLIDTHVVES